MAANSLDLRTVDGDILLPVIAQPGSRRNGVTGVHDGRLKVAVTQVAEKGKANKELVKVLAAALGLKKSQVTLVSGETSSRKEFRIGGVDLPTLRRAIEKALVDS